MSYSAHVDRFVIEHLPPADQWPQFIFERPEYRFAERLNCATRLLDERVSAGQGERRAVGMMQGSRAVFASYAQLLAQANRIAQVLTRDLGLVPGNRVLLRAANQPMLAACLLAVFKAGLVAVPTMPLLRAKELAQIIDKARVSVALCDRALATELELCRTPGHEHFTSALARIVYFNDSGADALDALALRQSIRYRNVDTARDDPCLLAFTSGTTGVPKATVHFHRDVIAMCEAFPRHVLKPRSADLFCGTPPLAFTFGLGGLLAFPLHAGAATLLSERATPESLLRAIAASQATISITAPTFYRQMALLMRESPGEFAVPSLKKSVSAGEALPEATRQLWKQTTGIDIIDGIGGTEVMHIYIASAGSDIRRGAIGRVVPGYEAKIVDAKLNPLPPGQVGRLALRGPTGCRYLDDDRQKQYVQGGWNLPGDAFMMDADGYFYYQARTDDMIVSAGYNIAGPEVEGTLLLHPAVSECAVVGAADPERGQLIKAYVVLRPGHAPGAALVAELQEFVKARIAPYKYPRAVEFRDSLPRTETGKLQRFRLRREA
jgi:2-aminobenzoate-CoA ligase